MRAATGKDVNAHLDWSGVCARYGGGLLQPGGGRCNDNTARLIRIHPRYTLKRAGHGCTLVIVVLAWVGAGG